MTEYTRAAAQPQERAGILNIRLKALEEAVSDLQRRIHFLTSLNAKLEKDVHKLNHFSFEHVIALIERSIEAYRASCNLSKEMQALHDEQFKLWQQSQSR